MSPGARHSRESGNPVTLFRIGIREIIALYNNGNVTGFPPSRE
jgi:hypothetical protein